MREGFGPAGFLQCRPGSPTRTWLPPIRLATVQWQLHHDLELLMKKLVPDPPSLHLVETAETFVDSCPEHPPLFSVRAGISAEDALVHALLYLRCASTTIPQAVQHTSDAGRGFVWSAQHSVEMAKALIDALLDGIEQRQLKS